VFEVLRGADVHVSLGVGIFAINLGGVGQRGKSE